MKTSSRRSRTSSKRSRREEQLLSDLQYEATEREAAQKELQAGSTKYAAMEKFLASISRRLRQGTTVNES
ncbi:hypothetical protein L596_015913 [Steinernema carpocapsae]|uniref:Uncharacterized protein n=1 Tax=Steinernema carpocapsae TaxID=34508 RepID=A0A4U5NHF9_STECR|nr:hypothetical protein L596_015913 [Steinernema carpocapsae]